MHLWVYSTDVTSTSARGGCSVYFADAVSIRAATVIAANIRIVFRHTVLIKWQSHLGLWHDNQSVEPRCICAPVWHIKRIYASRHRKNKTTTAWLNGVAVFSGSEATVVPLNLVRDVIGNDVPVTVMA